MDKRNLQPAKIFCPVGRFVGIFRPKALQRWLPRVRAASRAISRQILGAGSDRLGLCGAMGVTAKSGSGSSARDRLGAGDGETFKQPG